MAASPDIPVATQVLVSVDGPVATVSLNRPEQLNAITVEMLDQLGAVLEELAASGTVDVVVLTGTGGAFSAGVDLKALGGRALSGGKVGDVLDLPARRVTALLRSMRQIVVAKIRGHCYTGALELALAADVIAVASEAKLGDTHARWGLRPTWGMSARLPLLVGVARARLLSHAARTFTGAEAATWGLAAVEAADADLDASVAALVEELTSVSSGAAAAYKALYGAWEDASIADRLRAEADAEFTITDTEDRIQQFR